MAFVIDATKFVNISLSIELSGSILLFVWNKLWSKWVGDLRRFLIISRLYTLFFLGICIDSWFLVHWFNYWRCPTKFLGDELELLNSSSLVQLLEMSDLLSSLFYTAQVLMFWCYLQVLQQLNVFSNDDVDSAAEALNDVSFKALLPVYQTSTLSIHVSSLYE